MSDILETIYGTDGQDALEKAAQAKFIEKLAAEYEVDLSDLTPEQLDELETAVVQDLEEQGHLQKEAGEQEGMGDGELQKVAAAYDAYGRVMAHGLMDELTKIASEQEETESIYVDEDGNEYTESELTEMEKEAVPAWLEKLLRGVKGAYTAKNLRAGHALRGESKKLKYLGERAKHMGQKGTMSSKGKKRAGEIAAKRFGLGAKKGKAGRNKMLLGGLQTGTAYGIPTAALAGGSYSLGKRKTGSALDALADERANEILGMFELGQEKVAADEDLDEAVTIHAFEKLAEAGYPVDEMIAALQETE